MDLFGRKPDALTSPEFIALAWHLAGACEVASVVLDKKEDLEVQEVGRVLGALSLNFSDRFGMREAPQIKLPATTTYKSK